MYRYKHRIKYIIPIILLLIIVPSSVFAGYYFFSGQITRFPATVVNPNGLTPILYETTIYNMSNGQSAVQTAQAFNSNFIFRGTFQWGAGYGGSGSFSPNATKVAISIRALKQQKPNLLYEGGIGVQYLPASSTWVNGSTISSSDFNNMVCRNSTGGWLQSAGFPGYVPDINSLVYQKYLIQWSEWQINEGVDGMFFDAPYQCADYDVNTLHQSITLYNAAGLSMNSVVQTLKSYTLSVYNRQFFTTENLGRCDGSAGDLTNALKYPSTVNFLTYFSCSPNINDLNATTNPTLQPVENFTTVKSSIQNVINIPLMVFIDWPREQATFSGQTTQQQIVILTNLNYQLTSHSISFVYEVYHYGPPYDSILAGTYAAQVQIATGNPIVSTQTSTKTSTSTIILTSVYTTPTTITQLGTSTLILTTTVTQPGTTQSTTVTGPATTYVTTTTLPGTTYITTIPTTITKSGTTITITSPTTITYNYTGIVTSNTTITTTFVSCSITCDTNGLVTISTIVTILLVIPLTLFLLRKRK